MEIYTDDSKHKNNVAVAAVMNKDVFSARLPDETIIFSADAIGFPANLVYKGTMKQRRLQNPHSSSNV